MRAVVIGLGPHGLRIARVINEMPGLTLVGVVDRDPGTFQADEVPEDCVCTDDVEQALALAPDVVCIATNGPSHEALAVQCMEAGVGRVLVEKPMATSVVACDRMIAVAAATGARLSVDQSRRHDPFYRWLREEIRSGRWGEPRTGWIQFPGIGLGCLGTHHFDLVRFLFDSEVERVTAWVDEPVQSNPRGEQFVDPGGLVALECGSDLRMVVAQIEDGAGPRSIELNFTAARIQIDERMGVGEIIERDLSIIPGPGRPPAYIDAPLPEHISPKINMFVMLRGVLEELCGEEQMDCDGVHGRQSVEVLAAAHASHAANAGAVRLPLSAEEWSSKEFPVT